jgi:putative ribosome biogenesis GTPase RsgA
MRILPRRTVFRRKPPIAGGKKLITFEGEERFAGGSTLEQVIAANMDLILVVAGLDGDYSLNRIRRYLILARCSGAKVAVVLNKTDLGDPARAIAVPGRGRVSPG